MHTRLEVLYLWERINKILSNQGYFHSVGLYENGKRFELWFQDENNYHVREYGNKTIDRAYEFLEGFIFGLELGLLEFTY